MELEKYYASKGYALPKYSFINTVDERGVKMYCAEVILPNGVTISGEPRHSYVEVRSFCSVFFHYKFILFIIIYSGIRSSCITWIDYSTTDGR